MGGRGLLGIPGGRPGAQTSLLLATMLTFGLLPLFLDTAGVVVVFEVMRYIGLGMALNIFYGFTGYVNFGHVAYYGLGAYFTAIYFKFLGVPMAPAILLGGLTTAGFSYLVALPLLRVRGVYFAIASLGLAESLGILFTQVGALGGSRGLVLLTEHRLFESYYFLLATLTSLSLLTSFLAGSTFGVKLRAIKEDEEAAETIGINTTLYKRVAFILSTTYTALIGGVAAILATYISPETQFRIIITIESFVVTLLGGAGTVFGPMVGGVVYYIAKINLLVHYPYLHYLIFGSLMVAVVTASPKGLVGSLGELLRRRALVRAARAARPD
jgi:branched-chain amino acid transport system permease protein